MKMNLRNPFRFIPALVLATLAALPMTGCGGGGGGSPVYDDRVYAIAIQGDGKIVATGDSYNGNSGWQVALMRFNSNGSLDTSFGSGGKVLTSVYGGARAVAIQGDGKIVVGGLSYDGTNVFVLMRYNTDGSLDSSFGTGGKVLTLMNGGIAALAIQGDNKIVASGYAYNGLDYDFALVRYASNGTLDTTFGSSGIVRTNTATPFILGSGASSVAIQSDGKIVAAGGSSMIRYNADGTLDITFGTGGKVSTGSYYEQTSVVAIQTDGKIVAAGSSLNPSSSYDLALTRYNSDGSPDTTFAGSGRVVTSVMNLYPLAPAKVVVDPVSGKIVAAGYSQYQSVIVRYTGTGLPDTTLASGGKMILTNGSYSGYNSTVNDVAVQGDSKILVAGSTYRDMGSGYDFALERHNSDGTSDNSFGNLGVAIAGM